jgi:hypothetical protein
MEKKKKATWVGGVILAQPGGVLHAVHTCLLS